jgi:single-strand DNA-binding protein
MRQMLELNKVMLIGNLTRDPELSYLPSGTAVAKMGLAVSRRYKDRNGEMKEETSFIDLEAWAKQAEFCSQYLKKGKRIFVEGRLKQDRWEQDGNKRSKISVSVDRITFADGPKPTGDTSGGDEEESYTAPAQPRQAPSAVASPRPASTFPAKGGDADIQDDSTADDLPF